MLAHALVGLLPPLDPEEDLEVALAWSAAGRHLRTGGARPFRAPHHSASMAAVIGGGSGMPLPGEVTLAHGGVLFLDELGEFPVHLLDALRQPLEDSTVTVSRRGSSVEFPCRFQLVAATNPCPCGFRGDRLRSCECSGRQLERYRRRMSGPLMDRVDIRVRVPRLAREELDGPRGEPASRVRGRVVEARSRQAARGKLNRELSRADLDRLRWDPGATAALSQSVDTLRLTARGWDKVRRIAATLADLEAAAAISEDHVVEAVALRGPS